MTRKRDHKAEYARARELAQISGVLNVGNRTLYHGDNLPILRGINSNTIDLIATDPPFNKGRDFHATPESLAAGASFQDRWSWERDVHQSWIDQIADDAPAVAAAIESTRQTHSDGMAAFMCFMAVRLMSMRRILKPTGSLFLHCDATASHYLKTILDAVFGISNFRCEIIWKRTAAASNSAAGLQKENDIIFWYSKQKILAKQRPIFKPISKKTKAEYRFKEKSTGRLYRHIQLACSSSLAYTPSMVYEYCGFTMPWRHNKKNMAALEKEGRIKKRDGKPPVKKIYLDESKGTKIGNLWNDLPALSACGKERVGYPTQKPLALYDRIIRLATDPGDVVLDPFAGCATTCIAAELAGRNWIGIDLWPKAGEVVKARLEKEASTIVGGAVYFTDKPPARNDDGLNAAPVLSTRYKNKAQLEPPGPQLSHAEMREKLIEQHGCKCQGCGREFDVPDYLELDHNTPRSDGGLNHISNRILLCGPCNRRKSNRFTLSGLREHNRKSGFAVATSNNDRRALQRIEQTPDAVLQPRQQPQPKSAASAPPAAVNGHGMPVAPAGAKPEKARTARARRPRR